MKARTETEALEEATEARTTPIGLFNYATAYFVAALALERVSPKVVHHQAPADYLHFHAIELFLKAYLRAKGYSLRKLHRLSHDHARLLRHAVKHGLSLDEEDVEVAALIDREVYSRARYLATGWFVRPHPEALFRTNRSLHDQVGDGLREMGHPARVPFSDWHPEWDKDGDREKISGDDLM